MVAGSCMDMCPRSEVLRRQKLGLIHVLEADETTTTTANRRSRATIATTAAGRMVKCFTRSAAGQAMAEPSVLRPAAVLLHTTQYLMRQILWRRNAVWSLIYAFCLDRLRSVRQDLTIQQCCDKDSLHVLRLCTLFHLIAVYKSRDCSVADFDAHINATHLRQCVHDALRLQMALSCGDQERRICAVFEAVHLLLNIDDTLAFQRAFTLAINSHDCNQLRVALQFCHALTQGNFVRCFRLRRRMCPLLQLCVYTHVASLRRESLLRISVTYRGRSPVVPLTLLADWLDYDDVTSAQRDVLQVGGVISDDGMAVFKQKLVESTCPQLKIGGVCGWLDEISSSELETWCQ